MKLVILCIVFVLAIIVAPNIFDNQGYVFISLGSYTVETSVVVAVFSVLLLFTTIVIAYNLLKFVFSCKNIFSSFFDKRRKQSAQENLYLGIIALTEQRYEDAHKYLVSDTHVNHRSVVSYIIAAKAAIQAKKEKECIASLEKAEKLEPRAKYACYLLRASLYSALSQPEKARDILEKIVQKNTDNVAIFRNLADVYMEMGEIDRLKDIIPKVKSLRAFPIDDFMKMQIAVYEKDFNSIETVDDLNCLWNQVSRSMKKNSQIVGLFARKYAEMKDINSAEKLFIEALRKRDQVSVLKEISSCSVNLPHLLDKLIAMQSELGMDKNENFNRALANQYFAKQDYPSALKYFQKLIDIHPINDDYIKIARCYEAARLFEKSNINLKKVLV